MHRFQRFFPAVALLLAACGAQQESQNVQFAGSNEPVAGVDVVALVGAADDSGEVSSFAIDNNVARTETDDEGRFALAYREDLDVPEVTGVQVTIEVPSLLSDAVGRFDFRSAIDPEQPGADLEVVEPTPCVAGVDCGTPQLPDLVPIIGWGDVPADVAERLRPATEGPPTAGLFPAETWFISNEDGRRLLRFATVAANFGDGPLDVIAAPGSGESAPTWQRIWTDTWHFEDVASGEFIFHPEHDHIHFDAFERYRLLDASGAVVASSEKVSFCLRDSVRLVSEAPSPTGPMLVDTGDCGMQQQVINAGFGDHYHALLEDQWIDITGIPAGDYVVEIAIDPFDNIVESDETNNIGSFPITVN